MFKSICIIAALSAAPVAAQAQTVSETCEKVGELAGLIMTARQNGAAISKVMAAMDADSFEKLVINAYEQPRYSGQEYKKRAVEDFRNEVETACFKEFL